jgi:cell shape-determining protein MreD
VTAVFFLLVGIALVVLQTSVLPMAGLSTGGCDLLVPLVVFLGLQERLCDGLPTALFIGLAVDSLSGAPPGYYATAYFWIWALMRWLIGFLQVTGTLMLPVAMAGAVLVENLVLVAIPVLLGSEGPAPARAVEIVAWQAAWTVIIGPVMVAGFILAQRRLRRDRRQVQARRAVRE